MWQRMTRDRYHPTQLYCNLLVSCIGREGVKDEQARIRFKLKVELATYSKGQVDCEIEN